MVTIPEFNRFVNFARQRLENQGEQSLAQLLHAWEEQCDDAASIEAIREGLAEASAGKGKAVSEAFARIRANVFPK